MRVEFDGSDYDFMLTDGELRRAIEGENLEAELLKPFQEGTWAKKAFFRYGDNRGMDGMKLDYFPEGELVFDKIDAVRLTINQKALEHVQGQGHFGTRYNGSDKVTVTIN